MTASRCPERALRIACGTASMTAVLHLADKSTGVLVVVGGPQYRAGSHRQFVLLGRSLAAAGFPVLRFDGRGMGDSTGRFPGFENSSDDIAAALDTFFAEVPTLRHVVLWGLCDGASAALMYLQSRPADCRVGGLCLLNPWVRSPQSLAQARSKHYYRERLLSSAFWRKLLSGGVSPAALVGWWRAWRGARQKNHAKPAGPVRFQDRMRDGLLRFEGRSLLVLSGKDLTAQEFTQVTAEDADWRQALTSPRVTRCDFRDADHTFSELQVQMDLFRATLEWLNGAPGHRPADPAA
jgi:uncharacterized protein